MPKTNGITWRQEQFDKSKQKKRTRHAGHVGFSLRNALLNDESVKRLEKSGRILGVCSQLDGAEQIQTENTHNGFSVYDITAGGKVYIDVGSGNDVYKVSDIGNGGKTDFYSFHEMCSFTLYLFSVYIISENSRLVNTFLKIMGIMTTGLSNNVGKLLLFDEELQG
jgi:hypothetical protein